ncbi:hypothetical protein Droror1_Dr00011369 [Drosera rotundifolia]
MKTTTKTPPPTSTPFRYFPPEILAEILSRLPVDTLLRFRCVSKVLRSLIENPNFIPLHLANYTRNPLNHHHHPNPRIVSWEYVARFDGPSSVVIRRSDTFENIMQIVPDFGEKWVGGYVNGLMMLYHPIDMDIVIVNPSIRRWMRLPPSPLWGTHMMDAGIGFVDGNYKVVGIMAPVCFWRLGAVDLEKVDRFYVGIYSFRDHSWRSIEVSLPYFPPDNAGAPAFLNDVVHWIGYDVELPTWSSARYIDNRVISFNLVTEMLDYFELPKYRGNVSPRNSKVNVMDQFLALFDLFSEEVCIWVMEGYGKVESWTRRYTIDILYSQFVRLEKNDELLLVQEYDGLHIYDVKTKKLDTVRGIGGVEMRYANFHVESLALLTETYGHAVNVLCSKKED